MKHKEEEAEKQGLLTKVKLLFFSIAHEMLKYCSYSHTSIAIDISFSYIQLLYFPFHSGVRINFNT